jgi:recombination protein RecR
MEYPSQIVKQIVEKFSRLPGIGKRTATRMVLNLLKQSPEEIDELGSLILRVKTEIRYCEQCHNISDTELCSICSDTGRDQTVICVVEDLRDVMAIENTNQFKGTYHILGGLISPIDGISAEQLNIASLISRVNAEKTKELIFALSATIEGDTTMFYISRQLKDEDIRFTSIARGIAVGGELEYADEITLGRSILNRIPYQI